MKEKPDHTTFTFDRAPEGSSLVYISVHDDGGEWTVTYPAPQPLRWYQKLWRLVSMARAPQEGKTP